MFIYNVTVSISNTLEAEWLQWMKQTHIPNVLNTGMFLSYQIYKVLSHDDPATNSFCVMYQVEKIENFVRYLNEFAPAMRAEMDKTYGGQYAAFRTLLEEV